MYFDKIQSPISNRTIEKEGMFSPILILPIAKKINPIIIIDFAKSFWPAAQIVSFFCVHLVFMPKKRFLKFGGNIKMQIAVIIRNKPICM
jgi:hypothetical protein